MEFYVSDVDELQMFESEFVGNIIQLRWIVICKIDDMFFGFDCFSVEKCINYAEMITSGAVK